MAQGAPEPIPVAVGIGLRHPHDAVIAAEADDLPRRIPWLEVHSENYLCDGGARLAMLEDVRRRYPLSCHGVGLSLGSAEGLDPAHVARLARLFERMQPAFISEHLSWSVVDGVYLNDLLPLPYTAESLNVVADNIARAQDAFGRRILVENPARYVEFARAPMTEAEFLSRLVALTGCGLLLDINNVFVSAANTGDDAVSFLRQIPADAVEEIHLAGHTASGEGAERILIDTHSTPVCAAVWELFSDALTVLGPKPTLIEWDRDLPALEVLIDEARRAQRLLDRAQAEGRGRHVA